MDKTKVEIPMEQLHVLVTRFDMTIDEAIRASVEGAVKVITDDLKAEYEEYVETVKENNSNGVCPKCDGDKSLVKFCDECLGSGKE